MERRMLNRSGRLILAKSTLSAIPVHISMAIKAAPWAVKAIDALGASFGVGRKWPQVENVRLPRLTPKDPGGLSIPNLQLMGMVPRMRWMWLARTDLARTWSGFKFPYWMQS